MERSVTANIIEIYTEAMRGGGGEESGNGQVLIDLTQRLMNFEGALTFILYINKSNHFYFL